MWIKAVKKEFYDINYHKPIYKSIGCGLYFDIYIHKLEADYTQKSERLSTALNKCL